MKIVEHTETHFIARDTGLWGRMLGAAFIFTGLSLAIGAIVSGVDELHIALLVCACTALAGVFGFWMFGEERLLAIDSQEGRIQISKRHPWGQWEMVQDVHLALLRRVRVTETRGDDAGGPLYGVVVELADGSEIDVLGQFSNGLDAKEALAAAISSFVSTSGGHPVDTDQSPKRMTLE